MKYSNPIYQQKLGDILKLIRKSKNIKAQTVADALGLSDQSNYVRIENAQVTDISFWRLLEICDALGCSLFQICFLLEIDFLGGGAIKTWDQFYDSLKQLEEQDKKQLLELADILKKNAGSKSGA
jgi:DNA-binding Xre family transcriptional regulator